MPIDVKRSIIKEHVARPELLQRELAAWAKVTFKLRRISDILKKAETIMREEYGDGKRCRSVRVTSPRLESRLWAWIQEMERCNVCVSRELIKLQARRTIKHCFEHTGICFRGGEEDAKRSSYTSDTGIEDVIMQMHF